MSDTPILPPPPPSSPQSSWQSPGEASQPLWPLPQPSPQLAWQPPVESPSPSAPQLLVAPQPSWEAPRVAVPQPVAPQPSWQGPPSLPYSPQQSSGGYASWGQRVGASLMDYVFSALVLVPLWILAVMVTLVSESAGAVAGFVASVVGYGLTIFWLIKTGTVGQSPGKKFVGIKVVGTETGAPIGGLKGGLRSLAHFVDALVCYIGFLLPLFDSKKQTIADKIMSTVVVTVPRVGFVESFRSGFKKD